jgi:hypothetical protein
MPHVIQPSGKGGKDGGGGGGGGGGCDNKLAVPG